MAEYQITIIVSVPDETTPKEVEEWAKFSTGYTSSLRENNPIYNQRGSDIEAISCHIFKP